MTETIYIYTDGACAGNPGRGGYAYYQYVIRNGRKIGKTNSVGAFRRTTNIRMEMMAVRDSLKTIKSDGHSVIIHSDLKFVVNMFNERGVTKKSKNLDIWYEIFSETSRQKSVKMKWVKGHIGIEGNEICDQLAEEAARCDNVLIDEPYENRDE